MTDLAYEKEGSYLQGKADGEDIGRKEERQKADQEHLEEKLQAAREMLSDNIPLEKVIKYQNLTEEQVKALLPLRVPFYISYLLFFYFISEN